ncbi:MAG: LLM class flavin-dependent oxidoreductase [Candidatus Promineifilaceae bacterium]
MKIGLVINHAEEIGPAPSFKAIRNLAQLADASALDSIWLFDHLLFRFEEEPTEGIWECWTLLCALAEATERVEVGTIVLCNPFRSPPLLAKMAHTADEVSGGRLILGLGAGWHKPEFDAFGFPFDHRVDRLEESLQIIRPLLHGESVTFNGSYYQVEDCIITPTGPRPEGIPILVGAKGPRMLRLTAQHADQWNTAWLGTASELAARVEPLHAACAETGRDPATLAVTVGVDVALPDLGETNPFSKSPLGGSAEALAEAFRDYDAAGAAHLIIHLTPQTETAVTRLAEAARLYRGN